MSSALYSLGQWSVRRRRLVVILWLALLVVLGASAKVMQQGLTDVFTIPGTQSQQAADSLSARFPQFAGASGQVVVTAPAGTTVTDPAVKAQIEDLTARYAALPHVRTTASPFSEHVKGAISADSTRKSEILAYVEILRDELKIPIVYVSHSIEEVTRVADHLVLVADGLTVASGPLTEIMGRVDLEPYLGRFQSGAVIEARVARHDEIDGLTTLAFDGGEFVVPVVDALPGEPVKIRVRARDVAIALAPPADTSFLNILEGRVTAISDRPGPLVDVTLSVGTATIVSRLSRRSSVRLGLAPGMKAYALVKAVALDRHAVGFA